MARIFTCGFEEGSATGTMWNGVGGSSVTFVTTDPHSGTYHLRVPAGASNASGPRRDIVAKSSGTVYSRFYWQPATLPTSGTTTTIQMGRTSGSSNVYIIEHVRADNTIQLTNVAATTSGATTATVSLGTWYRIELEHVISTTVGSFVMKLFLGDATDPITGGTVTLNGGGSGENTGANIQQYFFHSSVSVNQGQVWYFDDVAINDTTGSFQTSWCGPAKTALLVPNFDEPGELDWTPLSGTDHFAMVDDLPGTGTPIDDDTTYVSTSVAGNVDWYGLTPLPAEVPSNATMILAQVTARAKGNAVTPTFQVLFWDGTDTFTGPSYNLTTSYAIMTGAQHLIVDLAGLSKATVGGTEAGIGLVSDTLEARVTAAWVNVEWLEAGVTDTAITPPTAVYSGP